MFYWVTFAFLKTYFVAGIKGKKINTFNFREAILFIRYDNFIFFLIEKIDTLVPEKQWLLVNYKIWS